MEQGWRRRCAMASDGDLSELCRDHQEALSVFCLDDLQPLCRQCAEGSHSQHRVYLLSEATADCKGELCTSLYNLEQKRTAFQFFTQDHQQVYEHNLATAERAEAQIKEEFAELHQMLLKEEADRLLSLRREKDRRIDELQEQSKLMDEKARSLEERIRLTEAELGAGGDGVQFLKEYQENHKLQRSDSKKPMRTFLMNVAKHLGNLKFSVWKKMKHGAPYTPVTLDPRTAGQGVAVPHPLNTLQCSPDAPCAPDHPERFDPNSAVLARDGFSSGVHCWSVEVGDCDNWTVGVASQFIQRKVQFEACPEAGLWCICLRDGRYQALTTPAQALQCGAPLPLRRVLVRLDHDGGLLEFRDADRDAGLFTFKHDFAETVYPYLESVSETGSLTIVPEEPSVSVALEGDVQEDPTENPDRSAADTDAQRKEKKTKKRIVKNGLIKTKAPNKQTPCKTLFSDEYHVSLFRSQRVNAVTCNQIKHG